MILLLLSCDDAGAPHYCLDQDLDVDVDGICDSEDDCVGIYDCAGICNGGSICNYDFDDILEVFSRYNCSNCHNENFKEGGIDLSSYNSVLTGGDNGPGVDIVNYNETQSSIWLRVNDGTMPYGGDPISNSDLNIIKLWINQGAINE